MKGSNPMELDERKSRLKLFLEQESEDEELLSGLKTWHVEVNELYDKDTVVDDMAGSKKLLMKHFPNIVGDVKRRQKLMTALKLLQAFETAIVDIDGISTIEATVYVQAVLNSVE